MGVQPIPIDKKDKPREDDRPVRPQPDYGGTDDDPSDPGNIRSDKKYHGGKSYRQRVKEYEEKKQTPSVDKKTDNKISRQQYQQQRYDFYQRIAGERAGFETRFKDIDPFATYVVSVDGTERQMSGQELKKQYYTPYSEDYKQAEKQAQKAYTESLNLPRGTIVKKTSKGYKFKYPDTRLDWTKSEFEKIDRAYKINPVLGGVAEFGFGAVSSFAALGRPIADIVAGVTGTKTKPVHYVSPFDLAFEPVGWSPKGSTDILKSRPVFTSGGIASEYLQTVAFAKAFKFAGKGVKVGVKGVAKRTPTVYSKLSTKFPTVFGTKITESGARVGSPSARFISKVGHSQVGKNVYRWAAKGYKPGKTLIWKSTKLKQGTWRIQEGKYVVDKSKSFWSRRKFLPPSQYAKYEKALKSSGRISIGFPESKVDDIIFASEGKTFKKSFRGFKTAYISRTSVQPVYRKEVGMFRISSKNVLKSKKVIQPFVTTKEKLPWLRSAGEYKGYPYRFTVTESGKRIADWTSGFGRAWQSPLPKSWISKAKYGFRASKEAAASLIRRSKTVVSKRPSASFRTGRRITMYVPVKSSGVLYQPLVYGTIKSGMGSVKSRQISFSVYDKKIDQVFIPGFKKPSVSSNVYDISYKRDVDVFNVQKQKQDISTVQKQDVKNVLKTDMVMYQSMKPMSVSTPVLSYPSSSMVFPGFLGFPSKSLYGRGRRMGDFSIYGKKYKFRMVKIESPFKKLRKSGSVI